MTTFQGAQGAAGANNPGRARAIPARVRETIEQVAHTYGLPPAALTGQGRDKRVSAARHEAMRQVRRLEPQPSMPLIGRWFGDRDHTSVLHALRQPFHPPETLRPRGAAAAPARAPGVPRPDDEIWDQAWRRL